MKLIANIYAINTATAEDEQVGQVILEGGVLSVEPDNELMNRLIEAHIMVEGEEIRPKRDPEAFVRGLHHNYRSAYFHAGPATEQP